MYESKIIIVNVKRTKAKDSEFVYADKVAEIDLGGMGCNNGWKDLFTTEIDFELFIDSANHSVRTDKYGDIMKEGDLEAIIAWLENVAPIFWENKSYRRIAPCLGLLKGLNPKEWDELHIVHYGY